MLILKSVIFCQIALPCVRMYVAVRQLTKAVDQHCRVDILLIHEDVIPKFCYTKFETCSRYQTSYTHIIALSYENIL